MAGYQSQRPPQLGATFYPGGADDFYVPEVVSPAPQRRITPEVPDNIQQNLARLELDAGPVETNRLSGLQSPKPISDNQGFNGPALPSQNSSYSNLNSVGQPGVPVYGRTTGADPHQQQIPTSAEQPTFSPFPKLLHRPVNVPPSDDERENILEAARNPVLSSNDPEMQLTWAQDALAYVETVTQNDVRNAGPSSPRPQTPQIVYQLKVDAMNVVNFLAEQQHPKADFMKGIWLEFGKFGYRMDKREAYRCFSRAAQKGFARAEYRMGMQYEESSNDPANAIKHYSLGVKANDSASMYRLGMMTLLGQHGQPLDYSRALDLIKRSAESADENAPQGAYVYGMLLAHELTQVPISEEHLPYNTSAAKYNIEKAAYFGFPKAQTKMGLAYELCQLGCEFDPRLSLHYNALASRQGEADADMAISKWFLCGYDGIFEKNEGLAYLYAMRAASAGLATAEFALGYFYEIGVHVNVDIEVAKEWYSKAAEHGNRDAGARIDGIQRSNTLKKEHQDVAVAKIRSQYGSQRGKRPERFKATPSPMPTISDSPAPTEIPHPDRFRPPSRAHVNPSATASPRSQSVAPYPVDDNPRQPGLKPLPSTSSLRPVPDFRPNTAMGIPPAGTPVGSLYSQPQVRPYSSLDMMGAGRGRGMHLQTGPGALGPHHYRRPSAGSPVTQMPPGAIGPHQYRQPSLGSPAVQAPPIVSSPGGRAASPANANLGFVAPPDPTGADRRRKLQKSDNPQVSGRPLPTNSTYDAPPERASARTSSLPGAISRPTSSHQRPADRPQPAAPPLSSRPNPGTPQAAAGIQLPSIPPKVTAPDRTTATPPAALPPKHPSQGKGPKTFQEMGVPSGKNDSECVIM